MEILKIPSSVKRKGILLALAWTGVCISLACWEYYECMERARKTAINEAMVHSRQQMSFLDWGYSYGGVYIPADEQSRSPQNPSHLPEHFIETEAGTRLALISPVSMLRQVRKKSSQSFDMENRLVSLRPLGDANYPDSWEKEALQAFALKESPEIAFITKGNVPFLRYLSPVHCRQECLACHAGKGFKAGDSMGGNSIILPIEEMLIQAEEYIHTWWALLAVLWFVGFGVISFGTFRILQKINAEKVLSRSKEQQGLALNGADLGSWDWDINTGERLIHPRWAEMLGYKPDELPPHADTWKRLIHPDDSEAVTRLLQAHFDDEIPFFEAEYRIRHKSGEYIWVLDRGKVLERDSQGRALRACGTHLDITKRKQRQEHLKNSQIFLQTIIDSFPDAMMVINRDYTIAMANQIIKDMAGVDPIFNRLTCHQVSHNSDTPCSEEAHPCPLKQVVESRETATVIHTHADSTGTPRTIEIMASPIFDGNGEVLQIIESYRDITIRIHHEEERLHHERQMLYAQKLESLGVLAGGIAHDFNNILMVIMGNVDLAMQDIASDDPVRDNLTQIKNASLRAADLTRHMLAYSGKGKFVIESINLSRYITEMVDMLKIACSGKAELRLLSNDNLPSMNGDPTQIRQVIMNLVSNSSEALGKEGGEITLATNSMHCNKRYLKKTIPLMLPEEKEELKPGEYVYLEVTDTGCGMDKETMARIFEPFFTTKFTGRGLGMAAVQGIVRGHHGAISITSTPGTGTTIRILFPASEPLPEETALQISAEHDDTWRSSGVILIADDEPAICSIGKTILEPLGFSVLLAKNGREAVDVFTAHAAEISCVLLDMTMPIMNGAEVYEEICRIKPGTKVILSSGYDEQEATQFFTINGLAGFLQKPYSTSALIAIIRKVMENEHA